MLEQEFEPRGSAPKYLLIEDRTGGLWAMVEHLLSVCSGSDGILLRGRGMGEMTSQDDSFSRPFHFP